MRIYLDTNVFVSLLNEELGKGLRGLGIKAETDEEAKKLMQERKEKYHKMSKKEIFESK
jgi:hypothetical protein